MRANLFHNWKQRRGKSGKMAWKIYRANSQFKKAGFISKYELELSMYNDETYLFTCCNI